MSTRAGLTTRSAILETASGDVGFHVFEWAGERPYSVLQNLVSADIASLRIQAECITSTAFGGTMCDCGEQIRAGVDLTAERPGTVMVYLPQEGRGHGLLSKVEIMALMNQGQNLAAAQRAVGRPEGRLDFTRIPLILAELGLDQPVDLLTDSAEKTNALRELGVAIRTTTSFSKGPR